MISKPRPAFTELHARSAFSFLRGASTPEQMVQRAAELGMGHVAITDRDGLYGSARAHHKAGELGLKAIVGAELTMEDGGVLPVVVRTRTGYQNLCRLLTRSKLGVPKGQGRVSWMELENYADGLTALTGDEEGVLHQALQQSSKGAVVQRAQQLCGIFGREHVYLEVHRHCVPRENIRLRQIQHLAEHLRLPLLASNAPLYATQDGRMLQDAFTCLSHHTHLDEAGLRLAPNAEWHLKNAAQMQALFADLPGALESSQRVVESIEFSLENLGYDFPKFPVPRNHTQDSFLREVTEAGARKRWDEITPKVRDQIETELALISKLEFSGYFLVVWDIVRWCADQGILVQGRGSAANSTVCFVLGITKADPLKYDLLFERFLTEGRKKVWPDIDLDLPSGDQREKVIQEMFQRYAPYGAAMTANVITYRGRSAMREMGKVLNLQQDIIERFTDLYANGDFPQTLKLEDQIRKAGMPGNHPRLPSLLKLYDQVYAMPRHLGQHSGGMVLCSEGLDTIVPLEPATMPGRVVVQWDKDDCEDLGIIKVDLLGLGMMAVLEETIATSAARGKPVDLATLPLNDPETFEMMQRADTIGVFQIESRAQMATLPRLKPKEFYDVVIEVAIIRPGPIVGNLVHPYLKRRDKKEKVEYIVKEDSPFHGKFKELLHKTLGVPLFQEQMLKMAMIIAGLSGSEAEELRRAMSFHRSKERMNKAIADLYVKMQGRAVDQAIQDRIVASIKSFALYGFPQSHAISFALLAYASVWLKVHRAPEFYSALLNCQPMGFYSSATLVRDAKHHGLRVKPVCIVKSDEGCTVEDDQTLRLGLKQLRGLSRSVIDLIVVQRSLSPWSDLDDFLRRCPMSRDESRLLAKSGALNALGHHRRSALWQVELPLHDDLLQTVEDRSSSLLEGMNPSERLDADYQATKLTVGPHPMGLVRTTIPKASSATDLQQKKHGQQVTIIGMVICRQRPGTAKGHCFISLEDETGIANAFVPSSLFEKRRLVITQEPFLKITGMLQRLDNVTTVLARSIQPFLYEKLCSKIQSHDFH